MSLKSQIGLLAFLVFSGLFELQAKTAPDEFVFNNQHEPETLDPHRASGVYANAILIQIFEGLMARKADWKTLTPGQAESYEVSNGGKTYVFQLRPNLKWSDGSPLTAHDFVYSWKRAIDPNTLNSLSYWLTDNIVGAKDYAKNPGKKTEQGLGVKALDDRTLEVRLIRPLAYFLQLTALAALFPVHKKTIEEHGDQWFRPEHIVSNGPYRLAEWQVNQKIVLKQNKHFWDAQSLQIETATALVIDEENTAVRLFQQNQIDWTGLNGAPHSLVNSFSKREDFRVHPGFVAYFLRFNTTRPPLNDQRVRTALSLAIDRKTIVEKITRAGETPARSFVPASLPNYSFSESPISLDYKKDLQKAKRLLAEAGFPGGQGLRKLRYHYNTDGNNKRVAEVLQQMWKNGLGLDIELVNQEWKVHLSTQASLDYDISRNGWAGYYPDPSAFLEVFTSESDVNQTGWSNEQYDRLFYDANSMPSGSNRRTKLLAAESLLLGEAPMTPIYTYSNFGFLNPEVRGFVKNQVDRPFIRYLSKAQPKLQAAP